MGDRTSVTLTVLRSQADKAEALFDDDYTSDEDVSGDLLLYSWQFVEVNYGDLPFLKKLQKAGIAYDSDWANGDEYSAGCGYCRFTSEGDIVVKFLYDNEDCLPMDVLTRLMDAPVALRQRILDKIKERTVLPWDDQERHGKQYLALQLIA